VYEQRRTGHPGGVSLQRLWDHGGDRPARTMTAASTQPPAPDKATIERVVAEVVSGDDRVLAVYWFGSRARGEELEGSDVDLAVLFSERSTSWTSSPPEPASNGPWAFPSTSSTSARPTPSSKSRWGSTPEPAPGCLRRSQAKTSTGGGAVFPGTEIR